AELATAVAAGGGATQKEALANSYRSTSQLIERITGQKPSATQVVKEMMATRAYQPNIPVSLEAVKSAGITSVSVYLGLIILGTALRYGRPRRALNKLAGKALKG
ncbi:MAG: hypothetical protein HY917_04705, partial [Candidatus Diapherotrites archaeon]|nr:hypothetical protein [Candidatus Diapherotrites archaeon]